MGLMIHAHVDGACRPNPGQMAAGIVLQVIGKNQLIREAFIGKPLGKGTNNQSEVLAIWHALDAIEMKRRKSVHMVVFSDSEWAVNKIKKGWKGDAWSEQIDQIRNMSGDFASFVIYHSAKTEEIEKAHNVAHKALKTEQESKEVREYTSDLFD